MSVLLELPVPVVEGADLPGLQPAGDAVEVEGVVTHPPGNRALLARGARLDQHSGIEDVYFIFVYGTWLAWHSMHRSMMWLRQMAQLSTTMSQAHSATAFHFFTSNLFLSWH